MWRTRNKPGGPPHPLPISHAWGLLKVDGAEIKRNACKPDSELPDLGMLGSVSSAPADSLPPPEEEEEASNKEKLGQPGPDTVLARCVRHPGFVEDKGAIPFEVPSQLAHQLYAMLAAAVEPHLNEGGRDFSNLNLGGIAKKGGWGDPGGYRTVNISPTKTFSMARQSCCVFAFGGHTQEMRKSLSSVLRKAPLLQEAWDHICEHYIAGNLQEEPENIILYQFHVLFGIHQVRTPVPYTPGVEN